MLTTEEHKKRHKELHESLDELVADFINETGHLPSKTTVFELMMWSSEQCHKKIKENTEL